MSEHHLITEITRRRILDGLAAMQVAWSGRLDEITFLSRLYDLDALPSHDSRFSTAARDISQHRFNNEDWDDDWVFGDSRFGLAHGSDKTLLAFLAEMLHPAVRSDLDEVQKLVAMLNAALAPDGYEIGQVGAISGAPTFEGRRRGSFHGDLPRLALERRPLLTDPRVLHEHLDRIRAGLEPDPPAAISSCKELIESLLKIILERSNVPYNAGDNLLSLYKRVAELLSLKAEAVPASVKGSEAAQQVLRTLVTTVQSIAELRNALGLGPWQDLAQPSAHPPCPTRPQQHCRRGRVPPRYLAGPSRPGPPTSWSVGAGVSGFIESVERITSHTSVRFTRTSSACGYSGDCGGSVTRAQHVPSN